MAALPELPGTAPPVPAPIINIASKVDRPATPKNTDIVDAVTIPITLRTAARGSPMSDLVTTDIPDLRHSITVLPANCISSSRTVTAPVCTRSH